MAIFAILSSLAVVNLLKPQNQASLSQTTQILSSDLKQQQLKSMIGDTQGAVFAQVFGVYFENSSYILFRGLPYQPANPDNIIINLDSNITLSNNLPQNQIVFSRKSGEFLNYVTGPYTIVIQNTSSGEAKSINLNRVGIIQFN